MLSILPKINRLNYTNAPFTGNKASCRIPSVRTPQRSRSAAERRFVQQMSTLFADITSGSPFNTANFLVKSRAASTMFPKLGKRTFSTNKNRDSDSGVNNIVMKVTSRMTLWNFAKKPDIEGRFKLKDGREMLVRRLGKDDVAMLCDFFDRAGPWGIFDCFSTDETQADAVASFLWNAASIGQDTLIAIVDGKVMGISEYEDSPGQMEYGIDPLVLRDAQLGSEDVCVAKTMVAENERGLGIGYALKKMQIQSARDAGYKAIVSKTGSPAVLRIVEKFGGVISTTEPSNPWTLIPVR